MRIHTSFPCIVRTCYIMRSRRFVTRSLLLLILLGNLLLGGLSAPPAQAGMGLPGHKLGIHQPLYNQPAGVDSPVQDLANDSAPNCRYGLSAWEPALSQVRPDQWGLGWYLTFSSGGDPVGEMEYVRMARTAQDKYWDGSVWVYSDTFTLQPPLHDNPGGLGYLVQQYPGSSWIIGNEPDRGPNPDWGGWPGQDGIYPELYAQAYYSVYHFIRERDPSARIGPAGLVEVTPGRMQYLDLFYEAYRSTYGTAPPLDFWTFHLYILPELRPDGDYSSAGLALGTDPALAYRECGYPCNTSLCHDPDNQIVCWADHDDMVLFEEQVLLMRQWMKEHNYQDKPLWLTEYSILHPFEDYDDPVNPTHCYLQDEFGECFTAARVTRWLSQTMTFLTEASHSTLGNPQDQYRLVQRWAWYSLYTEGTGYVSNIITGTAPYTLTQVGQALYQHLALHAGASNLQAWRAPAAVSYTDGSGVATATIGLQLVNNGDLLLSRPITITWYSDVDLSKPISSITVTNLPGCASSSIFTSSWCLTEAGAWPYWVWVDAGNQLVESDETDNVAQGLAFVDPQKRYLPLVLRRATP